MLLEKIMLFFGMCECSLSGWFVFICLNMSVVCDVWFGNGLCMVNVSCGVFYGLGLQWKLFLLVCMVCVMFIELVMMFFNYVVELSFVVMMMFDDDCVLCCLFSLILYSVDVCVCGLIKRLLMVCSICLLDRCVLVIVMVLVGCLLFVMLVSMVLRFFGLKGNSMLFQWLGLGFRLISGWLLRYFIELVISLFCLSVMMILFGVKMKLGKQL